MLSLRKCFATVVVVVVATASVVHFSHRDGGRTAIRAPHHFDLLKPSITGPPFPDLSGYFMFLQRQHDDETLQGIADFAAFLDSLRVVVQVPVIVPRQQQQAPQTGGAGGGGHSDAWWAAIAQCESGTTNGWRTGYFGLEGRPGVSSLSYAEQLAVARGVDSWASDRAWGCAGRADAAVPSG